jgi:hypothetical protein
VLFPTISLNIGQNMKNGGNERGSNRKYMITHLKAPANARAVYSPRLKQHVTSTESKICSPPSRARSSSTAARLVTYRAG